MEDTNTPAPTTTESSPAPSPAAALPSDVKAKSDAFVQQMAKSDDISDYIAERRDQDAEARGDDIDSNPTRRADRLERYKRSLQSAHDEQKASSPSDQESDSTAGPPPQDDEARARDREEYIRKDAAFETRANSFFKENPEAYRDVTTTLPLYPPADHVKEILMESDLGPELLHALATQPDAILQLNELSPKEAARCLGVIEGRINAEKSLKQFQPSNLRARTKAPPPMRQLSGGMVPPARSVNELAKSDDLTAYYAARKKQDAEGRRR